LGAWRCRRAGCAAGGRRAAVGGPRRPAGGDRTRLPDLRRLTRRCLHAGRAGRDPAPPVGLAVGTRPGRPTAAGAGRRTGDPGVAGGARHPTSKRHRRTGVSAMNSLFFAISGLVVSGAVVAIVALLVRGRPSTDILIRVTLVIATA